MDGPKIHFVITWFAVVAICAISFQPDSLNKNQTIDQTCKLVHGKMNCEIEDSSYRINNVIRLQ